MLLFQNYVSFFLAKYIPIVSLLAFYLLSVSGKKEGIKFSHNVWIWCIVGATITGAISGLYDKYLMQRMMFDRMTVQSWYNFYQVVMMGLMMLLIWYPTRKTSTPFQWRWSIPLISLFLVIADFAYFYSLSYQDALISIVSLVRRSGVVVSFIAGWLLFKEKNIKSKAFDLVLDEWYLFWADTGVTNGMRFKMKKY